MSIKIKLAAIAKDEGAYIPQWVYHHLFFGFDEIEIWLNNTTDSSEAILSAFSVFCGADKIKFRNADVLLNRCLKEELPFQQTVYSKIYAETLRESVCSHIIFLDLDEFWVPKDFSTSIKNYIYDSPYFDAISFQWAIDMPDHYRHNFSRPFANMNLVQKNRHLKTLVGMTPRMQELSVHNHIIENGVYLLDNRQPFFDDDIETQNKSLLSQALHDAHKSTLDDRAFILHQINRSPLEYLSSLLRGRGHKNDDNVFKANRTGYVPDIDSGPSILFSVDAALLERYNAGYEEFVERSAVQKSLRDARGFVTERFNNAISRLKYEPALFDKYRMQIKGVKINDLVKEPLLVDSLLHSIDLFYVDEHYRTLTVHGWMFDTLSSIKPTLSAHHSQGKPLSLEILYLPRQDVSEVYPDADADCGFIVSITKQIDEPFFTDEIIEFAFSTGSGTQRVSMNLAEVSTDTPVSGSDVIGHA